MNFKQNKEQKKKRFNSTHGFQFLGHNYIHVPAMMDTIHVNSQFWVSHILRLNIEVDKTLPPVSKKNF